jgi:hypothetical protein
MAQTMSPQFDLRRSKDEIVRKINRRISDVSTMPFNSSLVFGDSQENTFGYTLNFEPAITFPLGTDWLVLTKVELPVVYKEQRSSGTSLGLSDMEVTLLFATDQPRKDGRGALASSGSHRRRQEQTWAQANGEPVLQPRWCTKPINGLSGRGLTTCGPLRVPE